MTMLWPLSIWISASGSGVSIPQNTASKAASRIIASTSGERAMLSVASQAKATA